MKSPDGIVRQLGCQIDRELDRFAGQVHTFAPFTRHVLDACVPGAWPETRTLSSAATWMKSRLFAEVTGAPLCAMLDVFRDTRAAAAAVDRCPFAKREW
jgi:hypothetical protein